MKHAHQPRLSDRLSQIAIALDSGNGEAQLAFSAAERLDELESQLRDVKAAALHLRSTMAQVDSLLRHEQLFDQHPGDDPIELAQAKVTACLRVVGAMNFAV